MQLSDNFTGATRSLFGEERFSRFLKALSEEPPVSIRVNPRLMENRKWRMENYDDLHPSCINEKNGSTTNHHSQFSILNSQFSVVPWCPTGFYLPSRPSFTFDPLLHAGCYYVQEASSMFIDHVIRQLVNEPVAMLDLCAAPGGKSTAARAALPEGSLLVSNEPVRQRASILLENIQKWGWADCIVTSNYPNDFRKAKTRFDVILCDVPCSGEGMFRKDEGAIREWTTQNVEKCWRLQREIVSEAWQCLNDGGLLIYSTCTYNTWENERNLQWIKEELGGEVLPVATRPEWGITGSLLEDFTEPVYRFIPGYTQGEGLFMAVVRKGSPVKNETEKNYYRLEKSLKNLNILTPLPHRDETASQVSLSYPQAISYLRGEALVLPPDTPRGLVTVSFMGQSLGLAKNIGNRANNLYPKEWRIKSTHIPQEYESIFAE